MTIYLDVVFFMNLIYQLGILVTANILLHMHASGVRLILSSVLGSACYCVGIVAGVPLFVFPYQLAAAGIIGAISVFVAFLPKGKEDWIKLILLQFILSVCLAGFLQLLSDVTGESYLLLTSSAALIFLCIFCIRIKRILQEKIREEKYVYQVTLIHGGSKITVKGLLDTGNGLTDPISRKPVVILQKSAAARLLGEKGVSTQSGYRLIPYESIGKKKGILEAFYLEELRAVKKGNGKGTEELVRVRVLCAVYEENYSTNGGYELILSPLLL